MRRYYGNKRHAERFVKALLNCGGQPDLLKDGWGWSVIDHSIGNDYAGAVQNYLDGGGRVDKIADANIKSILYG